MGAIIVEGVLFAALITAGGALLCWLLLVFTPAGIRIRQIRNRRRIERSADLVCPIHGECAAHQLVHLTNGSLVCPSCYKETFQ